MKFSERCSEFLSENLLIDVEDFEATLESKFGGDSQYLDDLVCFMLSDESRDKLHLLGVCEQSVEFLKFTERCLGYMRSKCHLNDTFTDYLYEIICYFGFFYSGGLVELFKRRDAVHDGPRIYLTNSLVEKAILETYLTESIEAYRGMSISEYESGLFGMSWSLSEEKAKNFAFYFYSDKPRGVVVKAIIPRDRVLYFSPTDGEREIVVAYQTISSGVITQK